MKKLLLILCLIMTAGCSSTGHLRFTEEIRSLTQTVPEEFRENIGESLTLSGNNFPEIHRFLEKAQKIRFSEAVYLVANMSPAALSSVKADELLREFRLAFRSRDDFPWGKTISDDLFRHYILPNCISQEPFEKFREYLYPLLCVALENCTTMEEAALELNRWCGNRFTYKMTQRRDQGVFESLRRGHGRCEEMMLLYMAAAKTVCLPTRHVYTPYWALNDSNHAWVEVWCRDKWYYLGACEPADRLNKAWFTEAARKTPLVLAVSHGKITTPGPNEEIYRANNRETILNVTANYSKTCKVKVKVSRAGEVSSDVEVYLNVMNFGGPRPFAKIITDENGEGEISIGIGEFIATCGDEECFSIKQFSTTAGSTVHIRIEIGNEDIKEGYGWLRYPEVKK